MIHKFNGVQEYTSDGVRTTASICTCGWASTCRMTERSARDAHQDHALGAHRNRDAEAARITANMNLFAGPEPAL